MQKTNNPVSTEFFVSEEMVNIRQNKKVSAAPSPGNGTPFFAALLLK